MRYVPGPGVDETLALIDANGVSYAMNDQRNTPSAWADAAGNPNVQLYGAFGEEGPANTGRIGFTGQMRIPELGLDYYKARFYDPAIGRFLTPDPAGYTDSPNLYAYVLNDPVNLTDPSGLMVGDESDPIVVFGEILRRGSASSGGNGGISIGSGSFFHFLDPFASNSGDGQAPPVPMVMCPMSSVAMPGSIAMPGGMVGAGGRAGSLGSVALGDAVLAGLGRALGLLGAVLSLSGDTPSQFVVRGGLATPDNLISGTSTFNYRGQTITGFSVQSAPDVSVTQLARSGQFPNLSISVTTTAELAKLGVAVIPTPNSRSEFHSTVVVPKKLTAGQAAAISAVFRRAPNPAPCSR